MNGAVHPSIIEADPIIAVLLLARSPWIAGGGFWQLWNDRPTKQGRYERLTLLGPVVDVWDGKVWRRVAHRIEPECIAGFGGVPCANQQLPWRALG